jgi:hypothetical protein
MTARTGKPPQQYAAAVFCLQGKNRKIFRKKGKAGARGE